MKVLLLAFSMLMGSSAFAGELGMEFGLIETQHSEGIGKYGLVYKKFKLLELNAYGQIDENDNTYTKVGLAVDVYKNTEITASYGQADWFGKTTDDARVGVRLRFK